MAKPVETHQTITHRIKELLETANKMRASADPKGLQYAEEAFELAEQSNHTAFIKAGLRERIYYQQYVVGDFTETERLAIQLQDMLDLNEEYELAALLFNIRGICNDFNGRYIESRNHYEQTISILTAKQNLSNETTAVLGNAHYNLAKLYMQIESGNDRYEYMAKAAALFESIQHRDGLARVWNLKAAMLPPDTPIKERLAMFEKALECLGDESQLQTRSVCLANVGLAHCHMGDFDLGLSLLEESLEVIKRTNNPAMVGFAVFQLGEAYRLKGDNKTSLKYLEQAEETLLKASAKVYLNVVYKEWATNLAAVGDYEGAYDKLLKFIEQVSDRIKFDKQSAVEQARLKFELEKKEKESDVLRKKNEEIKLYNEKLQQSNAELNQFAYVASHDLKEPLRMVSNYVQLLEKSLSNHLSDDQQEYIRYASEGAKRMYKLIDSLLAFSRAAIEHEIEEVDLNDVLDEVLRIVLSSTTRNVKIDADELPILHADSTQMLQLFQNLIANAVKYNDKDEPEIKIVYTEKKLEHCFRVEDNGIGIETEHREKVFEIFKRLHDRESYSGTGIGLSICKKIIHSMNGRIWIEDSSLGGAAFMFSIPKSDLKLRRNGYPKKA